MHNGININLFGQGYFEIAYKLTNDFYRGTGYKVIKEPNGGNSLNQ